MNPLYEVTYKNMWPSDALNAVVRAGASNLVDLPVPMKACRAWFERGADDSGLTVRIEVVAGSTRLEAKRLVSATATHTAVCNAVDSTLRDLRRGLAARVEMLRAA